MRTLATAGAAAATPPVYRRVFRQAASLDAKAKELEDELREVQEADKAAQHKLQRLQAGGAPLPGP